MACVPSHFCFTHRKLVQQIRISYGDALALDEVALFYGFLPTEEPHFKGRLCAVHREHQGSLLQGLGTQGTAVPREDDVTQGWCVLVLWSSDACTTYTGSPYLVAREAGRLIELLETAPTPPSEGMPARLTHWCMRLLDAERRRLAAFLDEL